MLKKIAIVFIFYDKQKRLFLIERRRKKQYLAGEEVFPGGKVNDDEIGNLNKTLKREIFEELGVVPDSHENLGVDIIGMNGYILKPFLVTSWKGEIPKKVIDSGAVLKWVDVDDFKPTLKPVKEILDVFHNWVAQC